MKQFTIALFILVLSAGITHAQAPTYTASTLHTSDQAALGIKAIAVDGAGNVYYYKVSERVIEKIDSGGTVSVFGGGGGTVIRNIIIGSVAPAAPTALALQMQDNNANLMADSAGNLYFVMSGLTLKYSPTDGMVSHIAGGGLLGSAFADGGEALATNFSHSTPPHMAIDTDGNIYYTSVTSPPANAPFILKMDTAGILTSIAGGSARGFEGDGGPAADAQLQYGGSGDGGITVGPLGNIFIGADTRIRRIDTSGVITTVAGNGEEGGDTGLSFTDATALESGLDGIKQIAAGPDGSIFFINGRSNVHQITPDGKINTIGETGSDRATSVDVDKDGNVYATAGASVYKFTRSAPFAGTPQALGGSASGGQTGGGDTGGSTGGDTSGGDTSGGDTSGGSTVELPTGTRGPIALDLDTTAGDQMVLQTTTNPSAGDNVVIDVVGLSGATGNTGFQVILSYDATKLEWVSFAAQDIFAAAAVLPVAVSNGTATVSAAVLGGTSTGDTGSLGHATFKVLDGFSGDTKVTLQSASYDAAVEVGSGGAFVVIGGATSSFPTEPLARTDFDGDNKIGFGDFLAFAGAFGKKTGEDGYDARIDLDDNGEIGFSDFLSFASVFGQDVPQ